MRVDVECDADAQGGPMPRRLRPGPRVVEVVEVLDRWFGTDHAYVKLTAADGATYILRHDAPAGRWELVMFDGGPRRGVTGHRRPPPRPSAFAMKLLCEGAGGRI